MDGFKAMFGKKLVAKTPDVFTACDFADTCKCSKSEAQRKISDMISCGKVEHIGNVEMKDATGTVRSYSAAYRLTEKGRKCIHT
jgi:hypothetical protein